ncbi:Response regulator receiver domain-containing protein [Muriicola jejuensis]|uniref:Response regulator n=1 Tax=Muriicola jejuensis TaxID=504488 RepID=A0A6P0U829_9FLAO|nr:response regulator [Muriicola jejuensis]NER09234.1 response regulator [Muriicola jejuensis]SMP10046.1 Response regulator receiver domain-containing protein [Muriicola jejuensis]
MSKINSVCIIDDDPITVFGIKKMLNMLDLADEIKTYVNGKEAIDDISGMVQKGETIPQVIFLDINMPIMDGWQFLEKFLDLQVENKIRINIVTSSIDAYDRQQWERFKGLTSHVIDFKNKPIRKNDILEITRVA